MLPEVGGVAAGGEVNMKIAFDRKSLGRDRAIAMAKTEWWKGLPHSSIAYTQMIIEELVMPFDVFHEALESTLGRPVFTHELGMNLDGIWLEMNGRAEAPSFEKIISMIPAEKRVVLVLPEEKR